MLQQKSVLLHFPNAPPDRRRWHPAWIPGFTGTPPGCQTFPVL